MQNKVAIYKLITELNAEIEDEKERQVQDQGIIYRNEGAIDFLVVCTAEYNEEWVLKTISDAQDIIDHKIYGDFPKEYWIGARDALKWVMT